jgi:hypothetical protein
MPSALTPEAWAQIRSDYEHTDRPVEDICFEHGISAGTLRDRVRRWGWTRRREPIPLDGPPALPPPLDIAAAPFEHALVENAPPAPNSAHSRAPAYAQGSGGSDPVRRSFSEGGSGNPEPGAPASIAALGPRFRGDEREEGDPIKSHHAAGELDDRAVVRRLQGAVARLLPAIDATVARFAAGPMHAREMERAARALATLTRTLRELNALLSQRQAAAAAGEKKARDLDELRRELARRMNALIEEEETKIAAENALKAGPAGAVVHEG